MFDLAVAAGLRWAIAKQGGDVITVGMNYLVKPGMGEIFENSFREVLEVMARMPGHIESHLFRDTDAPCSYLIHSAWESRDAFKDFIRSDGFKKVVRWGSEEILAARPRHTVYGD
ncbi:MAG: antibiotic biosynthesis monooxygenase family protein [Acidobacteriota bacterium]